MDAERFIDILGAKLYTGVPDSLLRAFCDALTDRFGTQGRSHIICANEGSCVGLAAGHYMATGSPAVVYMQNSGEGNAVNPWASLLDRRVYGIPVQFVIGWRGEPGVKDEPQHAFQGEITLKLLELMEAEYFVISPETSEDEVLEAMERFRELHRQGRQTAFVVRRGGLTREKKNEYKNQDTLLREEVIRTVLSFSGDDPVVATTGKTGRELFELREQLGQDHSRDFLTVGSMGHSSSVALGIALEKPDRRVWCLDGDGAALMHLGAMAVIGRLKPHNLIHIVINNGAHESVGGLPTGMGPDTGFWRLAKVCGYRSCMQASDPVGLKMALSRAVREEGPVMVEVRAAIGSRPDLGRPTTSSRENLGAFMEGLRGLRG